MYVECYQYRLVIEIHRKKPEIHGKELVMNQYRLGSATKH